MNRWAKFLSLGLIAIVAVFLAAWYRGHAIAVLQPQGTVGVHERNLLILTVALGLAVIIPVFILTIVIATKYREDKKATYTPDWDHNRLAEFTWWGIPIIIIGALSIVTWVSTHQLDPYKPLASSQAPMRIEVVALDWKWLFIYPDQGIATANYVQFPTGTPVTFQITADAPMNSFWIPSLGGQIYAMPGMSSQLHLEASHDGNYDGSSANISGVGFAGMKFVAKSSSQQDFATWVALVKQSSHQLSNSEYTALARPSQNVAPTYYASVDAGLYDKVLNKYMMPATKTSNNTTPSASPTPSKAPASSSMGNMKMSTP